VSRGVTTDGRVIKLVKDCLCVCHEGPHWLYLDRLEREANRQLNGSIEALRCRAEAEARRLAAKRSEMERRGLVRIVD